MSTFSVTDDTRPCTLTHLIEFNNPAETSMSALCTSSQNMFTGRPARCQAAMKGSKAPSIPPRVYDRPVTTATTTYKARFLPVKVTQGRTRLDLVEGNMRYETSHCAAHHVSRSSRKSSTSRNCKGGLQASSFKFQPRVCMNV